MNQLAASIGGVLADTATATVVEEFRVQQKGMWAVWCKTGYRPNHFHKTRERALEEAARLARLNPAKKFHVVYFDVKVSYCGVESHTEAHARLAQSDDAL